MHVLPPEVTEYVIVAEPTETPVTRPLEFMVATAGSEDDQLPPLVPSETSVVWLFRDIV